MNVGLINGALVGHAPGRGNAVPRTHRSAWTGGMNAENISAIKVERIVPNALVWAAAGQSVLRTTRSTLLIAAATP